MQAKVSRGRKMLDDDIMQALLKRAVGYESDEIVEEYSTDENGNSFLTKRKITKKNNPPDVAALKFLLEQNAMFDDEIAKMTDEQLLQEKERLLKLLAEKERKNENANLQASNRV